MDGYVWEGTFYDEQAALPANSWAEMFTHCVSPVLCERWQRCLKERPLTPDEEKQDQ